MKRLIRGAAGALAVWAVAGPAAAAETYVLYDNFQSATLDPVRWSDFERSRTIESGALRIIERDWGGTSSDSGSQTFNYADNVTRSGPITQWRTTVRVNKVDLTGCAANPAPTEVRARVSGTFFNNGNRVYNSFAGDVVAQIILSRRSDSADGAGVLRVGGGVYLCADSGCSAVTGIGPSVDLGTVNVNVNTTLQIEWDRANRQFLFSRDKGVPTAVPYPAGMSDDADPGISYKSVSTNNTVANCASGPRAYGLMDVRFDNVQVNASAKP